jgi:hypothetical protein
MVRPRNFRVLIACHEKHVRPIPDKTATGLPDARPKNSWIGPENTRQTQVFLAVAKYPTGRVEWMITNE